ncbi:MAG: hypothetical protein Kow00109_13930 [Acidobacteriota bacterium]
MVRTVERAQGGNSEAFALLYAAFVAKVRTYIFHLVHDDEDADEATQQTFLQAFRALRSLRSPERFPHWLLAIARNEARAVLRWRRTRPSITGEDSLDLNQPRTHSDPTRLQAVKEVCRRLPGFKQQIIAGMAAGLSEQEIAARVHRSPASVKMHKHRLRQLLRDALG